MDFRGAIGRHRCGPPEEIAETARWMPRASQAFHGGMKNYFQFVSKGGVEVGDGLLQFIWILRSLFFL